MSLGSNPEHRTSFQKAVSFLSPRERDLRRARNEAKTTKDVADRARRAGMIDGEVRDAAYRAAYSHLGNQEEAVINPRIKLGTRKEIKLTLKVLEGEQDVAIYEQTRPFIERLHQLMQLSSKRNPIVGRRIPEWVIVSLAVVALVPGAGTLGLALKSRTIENVPVSAPAADSATPIVDITVSAPPPPLETTIKVIEPAKPVEIAKPVEKPAEYKRPIDTTTDREITPEELAKTQVRISEFLNEQFKFDDDNTPIKAIDLAKINADGFKASVSKASGRVHFLGRVLTYKKAPYSDMRAEIVIRDGKLSAGTVIDFPIDMFRFNGESLYQSGEPVDFMVFANKALKKPLEWNEVVSGNRRYNEARVIDEENKLSYLYRYLPDLQHFILAIEE